MFVACRRALFTSDACSEVGCTDCAVAAGWLEAAALLTKGAAAAPVLALVPAICGLFDALCNVCAIAALEFWASASLLHEKPSKQIAIKTAGRTRLNIMPATEDLFLVRSDVTGDFCGCHRILKLCDDREDKRSSPRGQSWRGDLSCIAGGPNSKMDSQQPSCHHNRDVKDFAIVSS